MSDERGQQSPSSAMPEERSPESRMPAADLAFSIFVMAASIWAFHHAYNMRVPQRMLDAPGLFPMVMSALIFITAAIVFVNALRSRGWTKLKAFFDSFGEIKSSGALKRTIVIGGLLVLYAFVLIPELPYLLASFIFLVALMTFLRSTKLVYVVLIAAIASYAVYYLFRHLLNIPLP